MYLQNKYTKWYNNIIDTAKSRPAPPGYVEHHHILPKSLGGDNTKANIICLTAREHFVCHLLLTKMVIGQSKYKMISAAIRMLPGNNAGRRYMPSSRIYQLIKTQRSEAMSGIKNPRYGKESPFKGKTHSEKTKSLIKEKRALQVFSEETKAKMGRPRSEEFKKNLSNYHTGKKLSEETKQRMRKPKSELAKENIRKAALVREAKKRDKLLSQ